MGGEPPKGKGRSALPSQHLTEPILSVTHAMNSRIGGKPSKGQDCSVLPYCYLTESMHLSGDHDGTSEMGGENPKGKGNSALT